METMDKEPKNGVSFVPVGISNLDEDFVIDHSKRKIYNTDTIIGIEEPITPPTVEEKVWYYYNSNLCSITHIWNPLNQKWSIIKPHEPIRVSNDNILLDTDYIAVLKSTKDCVLPKPSKSTLVLLNHSNSNILVTGSINNKNSFINLITGKSLKLHSDGITWYYIN